MEEGGHNNSKKKEEEEEEKSAHEWQQESAIGNVRRALLFYMTAKVYGTEAQKRALLSELLGDNFLEENTHVRAVYESARGERVGEACVYSLWYVLDIVQSFMPLALSAPHGVFGQEVAATVAPTLQQRLHQCDKDCSRRTGLPLSPAIDDFVLGAIFLLLAVLLRVAAEDVDEELDYAFYTSVWTSCFRNYEWSNEPRFEFLQRHLFGEGESSVAASSLYGGGGGGDKSVYTRLRECLPESEYMHSLEDVLFFFFL